MATVILKGMPHETKRPKVLSFLKSAFRKNGIGLDFWVTTCVDVPGSKYKRITISFSNVNNAFVATEILNNFEYMATKGVYRLTACIDTESQDTNTRNQSMQTSVRNKLSYIQRTSKLPPQPPTNLQRSQSFSSDDGHCTYSNYNSPVFEDGSLDRGQRGHSRSQNSHSQTSKLVCNMLLQNSLEMKLLLKKRMVIEEEQRLLLEEKKLKLIQDRATSFEGIEHGFDSRKSGVSQPPQRPQTKPRFKQKDLSGRPLYRRPANDRLPRFSMPCKYLLKEMQSPIRKYSDKSTRKMLADLIRLKIRSRINVAIKLQTRYMLSKEIYNLYRNQYPKDTDDLFVKTVAKDIAQSQAPEYRLSLSANEAEQTSGTNNGGQNWFIDTVGEGSSANVNFEDKVVDITETDDDIDVEFDPNDVEDWGVEDEIHTTEDNETIQV